MVAWRAWAGTQEACALDTAVTAILCELKPVALPLSASFSLAIK